VSEGDGSGIEAAPSPGSIVTTISAERTLYLPLGTAWKLWSGPSDVIFLNFAYLLIVYVTGMDIVYYLSTYSHSLSENECE